MTICLVTDRRRLGAAVGAGPADWVAVLERQVRAAAAAGVDLVQVREPDLEAAELVSLVERLVAASAGTSSRILVNDRLDVALAAGAAGVHLKERGFLPKDARALVPNGFLVGCSIHSAAAAVERSDAQYLMAGTVLPTISKPDSTLLGWEGLAAVVAAAPGTPVLAIGGIDLPSMGLLASSGAAGLAAVGAFIPSAGKDIYEFVQKRVIDMRLGFDYMRTVF
jgi:thiazole tautomerase (transcriptional regulator TenI)